MNEDAAKECVKVAISAIQARNWEKAERFLVKSIKLFDSD
jgi:hypothetical protein